MRHFTTFILAFTLKAALGQGTVHYQQLPAFPGTARDDASAFIDHGNVYLVGGLDLNFTTQNDVWKYSPASSSWLQLANFPAAGRQYARVFYLNEKPCIIGGVDGNNADLSECWCYNASGDQWTAFPYPNTSGRRQHVAVSLRDKAFFGLGIYNNAVCKDWWMYQNGQWERSADFPGVARKEAISGTWAGSVFVGIGIDATNLNGYKDFYRFDPVTKQWTRTADYPGVVCEYSSAVGVSDGLLVLTGINEQFTFSREVYLYKPNEDRWTKLDDYPYPAKKGAAMAAQGNTFYLVCGVDETIVRTKDLVKGDYVPENSDVLAFPNPFTNSLYLRAAQDFEYALYNTSGALVAKDRAGAGLSELSFPLLEKGLYFLVINQGNGSRISRKLIKD